MKGLVLAAAALALALLPASSEAHGGMCTVVEGAVCIEAAYDDGKPMAYCEVSIAPPGPSEAEMLMGQTGPDGRFTFDADIDGVWKVTVDDGLGHVVAAEVRVSGGTVTAGRGSAGRFGKAAGAIVGVSVIFGIFGLATMLRGRLRPGRGKDGERG